MQLQQQQQQTEQQQQQLPSKGWKRKTLDQQQARSRLAICDVKYKHTEIDEWIEDWCASESNQ